MIPSASCLFALFLMTWVSMMTRISLCTQAFSVVARPSTSRRRRISSRALLNNEHVSPDEDEEEIITKEMFLRDLLQPPPDEAVVKKKKKNKETAYKVLDNRDILPFAVQLQTPDPYTHPEIKKKKAAAASSQNKKKRKDAVEEKIMTQGASA